MRGLESPSSSGKLGATAAAPSISIGWELINVLSTSDQPALFATSSSCFRAASTEFNSPFAPALFGDLVLRSNITPRMVTQINAIPPKVPPTITFMLVDLPVRVVLDGVAVGAEMLEDGVGVGVDIDSELELEVIVALTEVGNA
jgi:hypothetical protein